MKMMLYYFLLGILFTVLLTVSIYIIMIIDTHSVMKEVKDVFTGKISADQIKDKAIYRYTETKDVEYSTVKLKLFRYFTLHNFKDGYIWAVYTVEVLDENGNIVCGSSNAPTKWKIHREKDKWEIIEIFENP